MTTCQQDAAYRAQRRAPAGRQLASPAEIEEYLDELVNEPWWAERFPAVVEIVLELGSPPGGSFTGVAHWEGEGVGRVQFRGAPSELTVLHEVAHLCAAAEVGSKSHDPHWARVLLELVFRVMGTEMWATLRSAFLHEGVALD